MHIYTAQKVEGMLGYWKVQKDIERAHGEVVEIP